jgi:hypothetical protein
MILIPRYRHSGGAEAHPKSRPFASKANTECMSMVTSMLLLAPTVVLLAIWIMKWFQPRHDRDPEPLIEHIDPGDRAEPSFADAGEIDEQYVERISEA